jgi:hypothetical protein
LVDAAGVEWGRGDAAISGPYLVAGRWPLDEPILGQYTLRPTPGIPPGDFYHLQLVVYEPDGTPHGAAVWGPVAIERPTIPFTLSVTAPLPVTMPLPLGGLALESASVEPAQVLPGEDAWVRAVWSVAGPFVEPRLVVGTEGGPAPHEAGVPLTPVTGGMAAWAPGDRYLTISRVPISPHALGGATTLWAVAGDAAVPLGTVQVDVTRTFTLPDGVEPLGYRLGDGIALAGAQVALERGNDGAAAAVTLYWQAGALLDRPYTVFVHLVGPDGGIAAQADSPPQAGRHPTTHWLPGEVVADPYRLTLPAGAPPGRYRLLVGMYDPATLTRLPVSGGAAADDAILVGEVEAP